MLRQKLLPAILVALPAAAALMAQTTVVEAIADECKTRAGTTTSPGTHWYYRVNRANNKHCWYLGAAGGKVRYHSRAAMVYVHNRHARHNAKALLKPSVQDGHKHRQTADVQAPSAQVKLAETQLPEPPIREHAVPIDFAARWPDLPESRALDAREIATISYADTDQGTDVEQQMPVSWPVGDEPAEQRQASEGEANFRSVLLGGALFAALLVAGGIFNLARLPRRRHSCERWSAQAKRADWRWQRPASFSASPGQKPLVSGRRNTSVLRTSMRANATDDLQTTLRELTRDLPRCGMARVPQSFAPPARTRSARSARPGAAEGRL